MTATLNQPRQSDLPLELRSVRTRRRRVRLEPIGRPDPAAPSPRVAARIEPPSQIERLPRRTGLAPTILPLVQVVGAMAVFAVFLAAAAYL